MLILQRKTGTGAAVTISSADMSTNPFRSHSGGGGSARGTLIGGKWDFEELTGNLSTTGYTDPSYAWNYNITKDYQIEFELDLINFTSGTLIRLSRMCTIYGQNGTTMRFGPGASHTLNVPTLVTNSGSHLYRIKYISSTKTFTLFVDDVEIGSVTHSNDLAADGTSVRLGTCTAVGSHYTLDNIIVKQLP